MTLSVKLFPQIFHQYKKKNNIENKTFLSKTTIHVL
jgi:hypothetical protein